MSKTVTDKDDTIFTNGDYDIIPMYLKERKVNTSCDAIDQGDPMFGLPLPTAPI